MAAVDDALCTFNSPSSLTIEHEILDDIKSQKERGVMEVQKNTANEKERDFEAQ